MMTIVLSEAIYDHLEAFRNILKPLFYVKLNSKHILLNKLFSKMPLNGRKWPRKYNSHHPANHIFEFAG